MSCQAGLQGAAPKNSLKSSWQQASLQSGRTDGGRGVLGRWGGGGVCVQDVVCGPPLLIAEATGQAPDLRHEPTRSSNSLGHSLFCCSHPFSDEWRGWLTWRCAYASLTNKLYRHIERSCPLFIVLCLAVSRSTRPTLCRVSGICQHMSRPKPDTGSATASRPSQTKKAGS